MKRWFLAAASLMVSAGLASADYVIIVANLGGNRGPELRTQPAGGAGMRGGGAGMRGGGVGMRGGSGAIGPGGPPGGGSGAMGPGGMRGGSGAMGPGGPPGGGSGAFGPGGPPGGGSGAMGPGGMRGGSGAFGPGGMGGSLPPMMMFGGSMGGMSSPDIDDVPFFVVVVVEVDAGNVPGGVEKSFERRGYAKVALPKRIGRICTLPQRTSFSLTLVIRDGQSTRSLPTVRKRFEDRFAKTFKDKPSAEIILELADWTLQHGLVDKFPQVMDKLVEADKGHPAAVAYVKIKADLAKPAEDNETAADWRNKLLHGYKITEGAHYKIIHNASTNEASEVKSHLDHLENAFRGYYYWFALQGQALSVPQTRQLVVLTNQDKDFQHFRKILTSGPVVVDGFFARRENLAVMNATRQDDTYETVKRFWKNWENRRFLRNPLLQGLKSGHPRDVLPGEIAEAQTAALILSALEQEAELATVSHDASRQLLFTSGLLPRSVAAPEWILFGMGSFFETPLQSPWAGIGAPSAYYYPRWQELKDRKILEKGSGETLRKVVSDAYFRGLPAQGESGSLARLLHDATMRNARATAWSLTYFLAKQKLEGLERYFKELGKMPRDIELDGEVLLGCFARAFGAVDANNKVDASKLKTLERDWFNYMDKVDFESKEMLKTVRRLGRELLKRAQGEDAAADRVDPITGQPIQSGNGPNAGPQPQPGGGLGNGPPAPPGRPGGAGAGGGKPRPQPGGR